MNLSASIDPEPDFEATARIGDRAFGRPTFRPDYLAWKYRGHEQRPATVISLLKDGRKIGQAAMLWNAPIPAIGSAQTSELVDLFVDAEHRSSEAIKTLYAAMASVVEDHPSSLFTCVPNAKSAGINGRFLNFKNGQKLHIRLGLIMPGLGRAGVQSCGSDQQDDKALQTLLENFDFQHSPNSINWTPDDLAHRIARPNYDYGVHRFGPLLAITRKQLVKGLPGFLICAVFSNQLEPAPKKVLKAIMAGAARFHGTPLFTYIGVNSALAALPGFEVPVHLRPSPMQVEMRMPNGFDKPLNFDRFETIDFDFG